jgi:hypothetical protein
MDDLERQLRDFSKEKFELFVHQYLLAKYPGAEIKRVDGTGGDAGIDTFRGLLASGPAIWQSKHFPNRIRQPQKKQVLSSIKVAFQENAPSVWTLCVPINLRTPEHRWFQTAVVAVYGGPDRIKLIQASDFVFELQHNRTLRDAFFPENALSKMLEVRKLAMLIEGRSQRQLGTLVTEYADEYLANSVRLDPRLRAVVTIGGDPQMRSPPRHPGLVWSISEGERTTHLFARDPLAYNLDPIKFSVDMPPEYRTAFERAIDAGLPFKLPAGKILDLAASSPLLNACFEDSDLPNLELEVRPSLPQEIATKDIPLRLIAGSGSKAKELSYVPFRIARAGRAEIELSSRAGLAIEVRIIVRLSAGEPASITLRPILLKADVQALHEVVQFLDQLEKSGELEISSLETSSPILKARGGKFSSNIDISEAVKNIIAEAALVSKFFQVPLRFPDCLTQTEVDDLHLLRLIATGEEFFNIDVDAALTKDPGYRNQVLDGFERSTFSLKFDHPAGWRNFQIFGEQIETGPVTLIADQASCVDVQEARERYLEAEAGEGVRFRARCKGPCRWSRTISGNTETSTIHTV